MKNLFVILAEVLLLPAVFLYMLGFFYLYSYFSAIGIGLSFNGIPPEHYLIYGFDVITKYWYIWSIGILVIATFALLRSWIEKHNILKLGILLKVLSIIALFTMCILGKIVSVNYGNHAAQLERQYGYPHHRLVSVSTKPNTVDIKVQEELLSGTWKLFFQTNELVVLVKSKGDAFGLTETMPTLAISMDIVQFIQIID